MKNPKKKRWAKKYAYFFDFVSCMKKIDNLNMDAFLGQWGAVAEREHPPRTPVYRQVAPKQ